MFSDLVRHSLGEGGSAQPKQAPKETPAVIATIGSKQTLRRLRVT